MLRSNEVLIALMNSERDMEIAREQHWYRIPVESVERFLKKPWQPEWLAFYQTKVFQEEAYKINYFARVIKVEIVVRSKLFPEEVENSKTHNHYYKLSLSSLQPLPQSIISQKRRRVTFIQTTLEKLERASEISDLQDSRR